MADSRADSSTVPEISGYSELKEIGRGGFSRVYRARQHDVGGRLVAIKVLDNPLENEDALANFEKECGILAALGDHHPNIVPVHTSAFTSDERPCIVMKLFREGSYSQVLRKNEPLTLEELLPLGVKIADALATAHGAGVLHRDVKPQNIFKSEFGEPALGDFGIADFVGHQSSRTRKGLSVHYAAPERLEDDPRGFRESDQYSLAATIFTLAVGKRPFAKPGSDSNHKIILRVLESPTPELPERFPEPLRDTIRQAMDRNPDRRYDDLRAFGEALADVQHSLGHPRTPLLVVESTTAKRAPRTVASDDASQDKDAPVSRTATTDVSGSLPDAPLNQQGGKTAAVPQSRLGAIRLSEGRTESLDADLIIGRNPATEPVEPHQRSVTSGENDRTVSRRHLELHRDGRDLTARILGKHARHEHQGQVSELMRGAVVKLVLGDALRFGTDSWLQYIQYSTVELSNGGEEILDQDLVIGRNPTREPLAPDQRAVVHGGEDRTVSRRHLELRRNADQLTAVCLGSRIFLARNEAIREISSGAEVSLEPGDILRYGRSSWLRYTARRFDQYQG